MRVGFYRRRRSAGSAVRMPALHVLLHIERLQRHLALIAHVVMPLALHHAWVQPVVEYAVAR